MTCVSLDELEDYRDGVLTPEQHLSVFEHVASCSRCQAYLTQANALIAQLEAVAAGPIPVPDVGEAYERFIKRVPPELLAPAPWSQRARQVLHVRRGRDRLVEEAIAPDRHRRWKWAAAGVAGLAAVGIATYVGGKAWHRWRPAA